MASKNQLNWDQNLLALKNYIESGSEIPPSLLLWYKRQLKHAHSGKLNDEQSLFIQNLGLSKTPNQDKKFNEKLRLLEQYISENGKTPPQFKPNRYPDKFVNGKWLDEDMAILHRLGVWCLSLRSRYRNGKLKKNREKKLREIGFYFDTRETNWYNNYYKLSSELNNSDSRIEIDHNLEQWYRNQKKKEDSGKLDEHQIFLLGRITKKYNDSKTNQDIKWLKYFEELKLYISRNNRLPKQDTITKGITTEELKIGQWFNHQLSAFRNGILSEKREAKLKTLIPDFGKRRRKKRQSWDQSFESYKDFIKTHNREPSQISKSATEALLGQWRSLNKQRYNGTSKTNSMLSGRQIELLKGIGFDFSQYAQGLSDEEIKKRLKEIINYKLNKGKKPKMSRFNWFHSHKENLLLSEDNEIKTNAIQIRDFKMKSKQKKLEDILLYLESGGSIGSAPNRGRFYDLMRRFEIQEPEIQNILLQIKNY